MDRAEGKAPANRRVVPDPAAPRRRKKLPHNAKSAEAAATPTTATTRRRLGFWVLAALVPVVAFVLSFSIDRARLSGRVLRNVTVWGVELGRLTPLEAERVLAERREELAHTPIVLTLREGQIEIVPAEVGLGADVHAAVDAAMQVGRAGHGGRQLAEWLGQWGDGVQIPVAATFDEEAVAKLVRELAADAIDDPPFDGAVTVEDGVARPDYPRAGWVVDVPTVIDRVHEAIARGSTDPIEAALVRQVSHNERGDVDAAVSLAEKLIARDVTLEESPDSLAQRKKPSADAPAEGSKEAPKEAPKEGEERELAPWRVTFTAHDLAAALASRPRPAPERGLDLSFDARALQARLGELRGILEEPALEARFEVDDKDRVTIVPSRAGTRVDEEEVAKALYEAAQGPARHGRLPVERGASPKFTTADAEALRIDHLVATFTTYHPCCQPRVENIHLIADMLNGVVVEPGQTFSVNEFVGPRTTAKGFLDAPSIADGEMVDTVGGGVSQFATTLFNALLDGGYEIVERAPHSFYFRRYPMGHEATLSYPKPDLVFRNDTGAGLLVRTEYGASFIRVKLFGDNEGRKVARKVSQVFDLVEPDTEFIANDALDPDEEEVREKGADGWSVRVTRIITFADGTTREESRKVRYKPRDRVVEVHSCRIPKKKKGYTGEPCPKPEEPEEPEEPEGGEDAPAPDDEIGQ